MPPCSVVPYSVPPDSARPVHVFVPSPLAVPKLCRIVCVWALPLAAAKHSNSTPALAARSRLKLFHELLVKLSFEFIEDSSLSFRVVIVGRANANAPSRLQNPLGCLEKPGVLPSASN